MAYAAAVTWSQFRYPEKSGLLTTIIRVVESDADTDSEWDTAGSNTGVTVTSAHNGKSLAVPLPQCGTVLLVQARLSDASTGTEILPSFTKADGADMDSIDLLALAGEAASFIHEQSPARFAFSPGTTPTSRVIFGKSNVDAGTDNAIQTYMVIVEGMHV